MKIISFKNILNKDIKITNLGKLKYILDILITWESCKLTYLSQLVSLYLPNSCLV